MPLVSTVFDHDLRVRYGECDPQNIVFNANYFLYFDVAFTELWREAIGPWEEMVERRDQVLTTLRSLAAFMESIFFIR